MLLLIGCMGSMCVRARAALSFVYRLGNKYRKCTHADCRFSNKISFIYLVPSRVTETFSGSSYFPFNSILISTCPAYRPDQITIQTKICAVSCISFRLRRKPIESRLSLNLLFKNFTFNSEKPNGYWNKFNIFEIKVRNFVALHLQ